MNFFLLLIFVIQGTIFHYAYVLNVDFFLMSSKTLVMTVLHLSIYINPKIYCTYDICIKIQRILRQHIFFQTLVFYFYREWIMYNKRYVYLLFVFIRLSISSETMSIVIYLSHTHDLVKSNEPFFNKHYFLHQ